MPTAKDENPKNQRDQREQETPAEKHRREQQEKQAEEDKRSPDAASRQQDPRHATVQGERGRPGEQPPPLGTNIANPGGARPDVEQKRREEQEQRDRDER